MKRTLIFAATMSLACAAFGASSMSWNVNPLRTSSARRLKRKAAARFRTVLGRPAKRFIIPIVKPGFGTDLFYDGQGREELAWTLDDSGTPMMIFDNCGGVKKKNRCDRIPFEFPSLRFDGKKKAFVTGDGETVLKRGKKGRLALSGYKILLRKRTGTYGLLNLGAALYR